MTDREKLIELIDYWVECVDLTHWYSEELDESLADYLIANSVTIPVRCGECESYDTEGFCYWWKECVRDNDFCSYGERREDED